MRQLAVRCAYRNIGLGDLARGYPNLVSLTFESYYLQALAHPKVEQLSVQLYSLSALENAMAHVELPRLRALALATRYPTVRRPLGKLVEMPWFNQLEELDVRGLGVTRQIIVDTYGRQVSHLRIT